MWQYGDPHPNQADLHFECDHTLTEFDLESSTWATRLVDNTPPLRRACHGAGVVGKHVYVVGGRYWDVAEDDYIFLNDIHILDTRPASTYSNDWRRYLSNESLSDVVLEVEGLRIPAHRVVLAARCCYFETMFSSGMRESTQQTVAIEGVPADIFVALLDHLYTDRCT